VHTAWWQGLSVWYQWKQCLSTIVSSIARHQYLLPVGTVRRSTSRKLDIVLNGGKLWRGYWVLLLWTGPPIKFITTCMCWPLNIKGIL